MDRPVRFACSTSHRRSERRPTVPRARCRVAALRPTLPFPNLNLKSPRLLHDFQIKVTSSAWFAILQACSLGGFGAILLAICQVFQSDKFLTCFREFSDLLCWHKSFEPYCIAFSFIPSLSFHDTMDVALSNQQPMRAIWSNQKRHFSTLENSNPIARLSVTGG
jgi:hypothetical protein